MMFPVIVGYVTIPEGTTRKVVSNPTERWEFTIEVPPGRYPVMAYQERTSTFSCEFTGKVVGNTGESIHHLGETVMVHEFVCECRNPKLYEMVEWDESRITFDSSGWTTVRGDTLEEVRYPVCGATCYPVNRGTAYEFWQVVAAVNTTRHPSCDCRGQVMYAPQAGLSLKKKLTERQARRVVERIRAAGEICPAYWDR